MKTVKEVSRMTGVSVRALHHYDAIGLLPPTAVTESGYRLYDGEALSRLQNILLFRELQFSLEDIKKIINDPNFDRKAALEQQIKLLTLQKDRLESIIALARNILDEGVETVDFTAFDKSKIDDYASEVKERWGGTTAYKESVSRRKDLTDEDNKRNADEMMVIFSRFGMIKGSSPDSPEAQDLVDALKNHITAHYYTCTDEILAGLGEMYTGDYRFRTNIDSAGGEGTAEFAARCISCRMK